MSEKKIMITGAHGFVGARALERYPEAVAVPGELVRNPGEKLKEFVRQHRPDILLNCAAVSDIGTCEKNPEASFSANVCLPVMLAQVSAEVGAKLVSFSSDQVYTGLAEQGPFREDTPLPPPTNLYARHKLEAEEKVLDIAPDGVLLRATWMYDFPLYGHGNRGNFLVNVMGACLRGEPLSYPTHHYRGITYVRQVVEYLDKVFALPGGVYNYGSENPLSMYETARALVAVLGSDCPVEEGYLPPRPNLWMDCGKLKSLGIVFDTTAEGFARCAADYGLLSPQKR